MNQAVDARNIPDATSLHEQESFSLSSMTQGVPLLAKSEEKDRYRRMSRAALSQLLALTDHEATLTELRDLVIEIEEEVRKYESKNSVRHDAYSLNLLGLIDELELLMHLQDERDLKDRKNKLHRRLSEWNPPRYLVTRMVSNLTESLSDNTNEALQETRKRLIRAKAKYTQNRNKLTDANLRLVFSVANRFRYLGLPFDDLVQEGSLGLIKAIERFDPDKGFLFSTYAYRVISQSIHLAVDKSESLVRKPFKQLREKAIVDQTRNRLEQKLGRAPNSRDLQEHLPDSLEDKKPHIERNISFSAVAMPLAPPPGDPGEHAYLDNESQQFQIQFLAHRAELDELLATLPARAEKIVRMRYGIGLPQSYTLKEISERLSLSSERVRQIALSAVGDMQAKLETNTNYQQAS
jgi:RNA polymerase nonessential primary-like sigma factor